jgi:hypothetical protein
MRNKVLEVEPQGSENHQDEDQEDGLGEHLRIRKQLRQKGSVIDNFGGFCETNLLGAFVCNGKKRGPTSGLGLQSSALLEDLLKVSKTCTTDC